MQVRIVIVKFFTDRPIFAMFDGFKVVLEHFEVTHSCYFIVEVLLEVRLKINITSKYYESILLQNSFIN